MRRRKNCSKVEELLSYRTFPKLEIVCDCATHLVLCAYATIGPMVDINSLRRLLFGTLGRVSVVTLLADAGYDSASNHRFARDGCGVRSVIPALHGKPSVHPPADRHRRRAKRYRDYRYGQRWQVEAVMSMIKRNLGSVIAARSDKARSQDVMLRVLTHNIMLIALTLLGLFYRASDVPLAVALAVVTASHGADSGTAVRRTCANFHFSQSFGDPSSPCQGKRRKT